MPKVKEKITHSEKKAIRKSRRREMIERVSTSIQDLMLSNTEQFTGLRGEFFIGYATVAQVDTPTEDDPYIVPSGRAILDFDKSMIDVVFTSNTFSFTPLENKGTEETREPDPDNNLHTVNERIRLQQQYGINTIPKEGTRIMVLCYGKGEPGIMLSTGFIDYLSMYAHTSATIGGNKQLRLLSEKIQQLAETVTLTTKTEDDKETCTETEIQDGTATHNAFDCKTEKGIKTTHSPDKIEIDATNTQSEVVIKKATSLGTTEVTIAPDGTVSINSASDIEVKSNKSVNVSAVNGIDIASTTSLDMKGNLPVGIGTNVATLGLLLTELVTILQTLSVATVVGPSGPPMQPAQTALAALLAKVKLTFK